MYSTMYFILFFAIIITNLTAGSPYSTKLERRWPSVEESKVKEVANHIHQRSAVTFPVTLLQLREGYITRVKLGNPPKEFRVIIDSGSDILWVPCRGCKECPLTGLSNGQQSLSFDPQQSSTASLIGCSDRRCIFPRCSDNCMYNISYADGDSTRGYLVSDELHLSMMMESKRIVNSSIRILFGCSDFVSGNFASLVGFDGVLGLGPGSGLSIFSQLSSVGISPMVLSHCLGGSLKDGCSLVFGKVNEPGIIYTRLYLSESHYNVDLQSITVNEQLLPVDSSIFKISKKTGTVIDSGTTLAILPEEVHNLFIEAIYSSVRLSQVRPTIIDSNQCFETYSSVYEVFPPVTLNFVDGAIMELNPLNYLRQLTLSLDNKSTWCIGWFKQQGDDGRTILGDIVLKDKIIVYDLINNLLGWKNFNCSLPVNVSTDGPIHNGHGDHKLSRLSKYAILAGVLILVVTVIVVVVIYRFK